MLKKSLTFCLSLAIFTMSFSSIGMSQQTTNDKEAQRERDAQIFVNKIGIGEKSKVKVELKDNKKSLKGYISEIRDENFVVTDKSRTETTIAYSDVKKVRLDRLTPLQRLAVVGVVILGIAFAVGICVSAGPCDD